MVRLFGMVALALIGLCFVAEASAQCARGGLFGRRQAAQRRDRVLFDGDGRLFDRAANRDRWLFDGDGRLFDGRFRSN